jgi:hypothetical protein
VLTIKYNILLKDMMNSKQKNVTPLTSEEENLLYDEIDNIEKRLA